MDRSTSSTSNVVQESGRSFRAVNNVDELEYKSNLTVTRNYEISNSYRLISVPMQAGYMIVDRKLYLSVLGGISNDILLRKKVEDESGSFDNYEVDEGLRKYNITGLIGTELGYTLGKHYSISIMPQLRQSINSVNTSGDAVRPTFLEFGFRFKYLVK